jgi:hypothetical protein
MKKLLIITCGIFITLLSNPVFAQEDPGSDPELLVEPTPTPIGDRIWVLAAVGLVLVFYKVRSLSLQRK